MACAPADDAESHGVVETPHLRITTSEDNPICAGTPLLLEGELLRIAGALELPLWSEDEKLDARFGANAVEEVCSRVEQDQHLGCVRSTSGDELVLAALDARSAAHELVHAVRLQNHRWTAIMFEEGLAQVLSGADGAPLYVRYPRGEPHTGPLELLELPRAEFSGYHYLPSQSFVSWLWETYERPTLMSFMNDSELSDDVDGVLRVFEEHFGLSLAAAEQGWRAEDRPDPIWGEPCIPERTFSLADGPIEIAGDFDCREPTVYGAAHFMSLWPMCLDVPETTRVRLSLAADHGELSVVWREPCDPGPSSNEASRDKYVQAGQTIDADIVGCRFLMLLSSQAPGFPPTPYTIRIEELPG